MTSVPLRIAFTKQRATRIGPDRFRLIGDDPEVSPEIINFTSIGVGADAVPAPSAPVAANGDVNWDAGVLPRAASAAGSADHGNRASSGGSGSRGSGQRQLLPSSEELRAVEDLPHLFGIGGAIGNLDLAELGLIENDSDTDNSSPDEAEPAAPSGVAIKSREPDDTSSTCTDPTKIFVVLGDVCHIKDLFDRLPGFRMSNRWHISRHPFGDADRVAVIKCIEGRSLKATCDLHPPIIDPETGRKKRCKLHLNIDGHFEEAQCYLSRWAIYGMSADCCFARHTNLACELFEEWSGKYKI